MAKLVGKSDNNVVQQSFSFKLIYCSKSNTYRIYCMGPSNKNSVHETCTLSGLDDFTN